MTNDDAVALASAAGIKLQEARDGWEAVVIAEDLHNFAELVATAEREACAKLCRNQVVIVSQNNAFGDCGLTRDLIPHFAGDTFKHNGSAYADAILKRAKTEENL